MQPRRIEIPYAPRPQMVAYHERKQRWACIVAHRRYGKTVGVINDLNRTCIIGAKPDTRAAYIAPYYGQAKAVAWDYAKHFASFVPGIKVNESELRIDYPNGSRLRLFGADNYDALRGIYLDDAACDEPADFPPPAWPTVIRPALADRRGRATFMGTPKGHGQFWEIHERAKKDPEWFSLVLRASETKILPQSELDEARIAMGEVRYQQEFECDFDSAVEGAYFASLLVEARRQGRVGRVGRDPLLSLRAWWDIGGTGVKADARSIWIGQFVGHEIRILDYRETVGQPLSADLEWMREAGYGKAHCVLPHDGSTQDRVYDVSYESALRGAGFSVTVIPNQGKGAAMARIEAVRRRLPACWFNEDTCKPGIDALVWYHEKRDDARNIGLGPDHDWASHASDAFGLMAIDFELQRHNAAGQRPKFTPRNVLIV